MNLIFALIGEHGPLRHQPAALKLAAPNLNDAELRATALALAEAIESHAAHEDELLFEPLAGSGRMPQGALVALRAEHAEIDRLEASGAIWAERRGVEVGALSDAAKG